MNKEKLEECSKLLEDSMSVLQKDTELWKQFLQFADTVYILPFSRSTANLCAESAGNRLCYFCAVEENWTLCQKRRA